jgi:hypothetical protein
MNWLKWVVIGVLVLLVVGVGVFVYNQGIKRGVEVTTNYFVNKIDSLNQWVQVHPPSPETTTIYVQIPPFVVHDTMRITDTALFKPDSLIVARYPFAVWQMSYNSLNGGLSVITYNGEKRAENKIGSFSIQGDDKFDFSSSPWKAPIEPKMLTVPFIYTHANLIASVFPDYAAIGGTKVSPYVGRAEMKLDYGVVIVQRVSVSLSAGLGYDKFRDPTWYPLAGIEARIRILGRY